MLYRLISEIRCIVPLLINRNPNHFYLMLVFLAKKYNRLPLSHPLRAHSYSPLPVLVSRRVSRHRVPPGIQTNVVSDAFLYVMPQYLASDAVVV